MHLSCIIPPSSFDNLQTFAGKLFVCYEICERLQLKQYVVSQQLAVLRNSDVVETQRESRNIIYSLRSDAVRRILRVSIRNTEIESFNDKADTAMPSSGFAQVQ